MKKSFYKRIKKDFPNRSFPVLTLVFVLLFAVGLVLTLLGSAGKFLPTPAHFDKNGEQEIYSSANVMRVTGSFANFADANGQAVDLALCFAIDENETYIIAVDSATFSQLAAVYQYTVTGQGEEPQTVVLTGISSALTEDMRSVAVSAFRTSFGMDDSISDETIQDYIGACYLDVGLAPTSGMTIASVIILLIGLAGFLAIVGARLSLAAKQKKAESAAQIDYADVTAQLDGAYVNKTTKTILCTDYIIGSGGLGVWGVVKKSEVVWAFSKVGRVNLTAATNNIYVQLSDGAYAVCASCPCKGEKNEEAFEEIKEKLFNALPEALIGYTKDNMLAAKKKIDEINR